MSSKFFTKEQVLSWNETASFPTFPSDKSIDVFTQLRKAPAISDKSFRNWCARPDRELDATNQKNLMDLESKEQPKGFLPVYKGKSFNLWTPDTGHYYAWMNPDDVVPWLQSRRTRSRKNKRGAHSKFTLDYIGNIETLPYKRARVAYRGITNAIDSRTVIACLLPPFVFIQNSAPYFLFLQGDEQDEAYLLGILSSIPLDWYARRFVKINLNIYIISAFPIPRPPHDDVRWQRVIQLAGRLACPDARFQNWSKKVGVEWGPLEERTKQDMIYELDAVVAHLYGLTSEQLTHIFETFRQGWDYQPRLQEVLHHYHSWRKK